MNLQIKSFIPAAALSLGLSACVSVIPSPGPSVPNAEVGGNSYVITQLTASTWTLTTSGTRRLLPATPAAQTALLAAIEKHSGCKVTDSNYAGQGLQLDAQVDCASRFKK